MTRHDEYAWCARQGMSQAEAARHMGVSQAAVSKAARRMGLSFSAVPLADQRLGRRLEMAHYRYPWEQMQAGDYFDANCDAAALASWANCNRAPMRFRSITRQGFNRVVRVA
jgi:transcriptional regulator with XRE-family HTH domain